MPTSHPRPTPALRFAAAILLCAATVAALAGNNSKPLSQETLDDIAKHEAIAAAHTAAAQCLRAGKPDAECEGALLGACKGIAFGKFCGMKH
jgi:hypothetical protein